MTDYSCPTCGGPGVALGWMGLRYHLRCRNCGMVYSIFVEVGLAEEMKRFQEEEVPT